MSKENHKKRIILLGASFNTGNLGVSALAESSVKLLLHRWPDCEIVFAGSGYEPKIEKVVIGGESEKIINIPFRFSKNIFHKCHFLRFLFCGILRKLGFKMAGNDYCETLYSCDLVCDITGGDSFSDIYGFGRYFLRFFPKWLFIFFGKDLIMLPQTYGPFNSSVARYLARMVLKRATHIYSRDKEGLSVVKELIGNSDKVVLCPDVAFVLEPKVPEQAAIGNEQLASFLFDDHKTQVVGLNVSGLLFNGGYTGNDEFRLKCDYKNLVERIVNYFAGLPETKVLLVPHVAPEHFEIENDLMACNKLWDSLSDGIQKKVFIAALDKDKPFFDQCEVKYIIGKCDFFVGSRLHATIAAMSQCVPTVGLAYSKKFLGVYETVGVDDCVVNLCDIDNVQVLEKVKSLYENREAIYLRLKKNIPVAKENVCHIFDNL